MYENRTDHPGRDPFAALADVLTAASRYDLLLGVVPLAFAVALVAATVLGVSVVQALSVAAGVGAFAVIDACYLNPPVDRGSA
ncbi:hypothetical protein ACT4ML_10550 [Natrinema sp. LN54]|uniref:hypothetical protein n=1 Tax=Natrinema sp. LN54 TaxID=3458705 RepID=UPI004035BB2A